MRARLGLLPVLLLAVFAALLLAAGCRDGGNERTIDLGEAPTTATAASGSTATASPQGTPAGRAAEFKTGQNNYSLTVDGLKRQFIVHVPASYDAKRATPLVFVFHGSAHNGATAYRDFRWKEQCDRAGCIAVFPTSMEYFVLEEGKVQTKWNIVGLDALVKPGSALADDVKFVRAMLASVRATFTIDPKRIYATGGSNGSAFVTSRLVIEMPDVFAAAGASQVLSTKGLPPKGNEAIPIYAIVGSKDDKLLETEQAVADGTREFPMEAEKLLATRPLSGSIGLALTTLGISQAHTVEYCDPKLTRCTSTYSPDVEVQKTFYTTVTFSKGGAPGVELVYRQVKGMGHVYANEENNPAHLVAAQVFWEFFVNHPKK